ncbi:hypothetical protein MXD59_02115 [Frankia sp. Ag45/Mut15]|uniref:Uncharacterized protein n=1 Tax=Frankia umida TaxID=573489 RepID=A0ABT0JTN7_9ACTN|nr:hypothetical protein [Frankia umida]MCK9874587.1 hypothetical protein [Frankia umida]
MRQPRSSDYPLLIFERYRGARFAATPVERWEPGPLEPSLATFLRLVAIGAVLTGFRVLADVLF